MTVSIICWVALGALFLGALFYAPVWVGVEGDMLMVRSPFRRRLFPVEDIADIRLHKPTMGEKRLVGSGGWFGYWGWFMEADTGRYFAYYGKASDCFMVIMRDGRKYLLGCAYPEHIVDLVQKLKGIKK